MVLEISATKKHIIEKFRACISNIKLIIMLKCSNLDSPAILYILKTFCLVYMQKID